MWRYAASAVNQFSAGCLNVVAAADNPCVSLLQDLKGPAASPDFVLLGEFAADGFGGVGVDLLACLPDDAMAEDAAVELFNEDGVAALGAGNGVL